MLPTTSAKLGIVQGDITQLFVDAIVNAANSSLLGGGGVDGAIHRGAGAELLAECQTLHGCQTGKAKITGGYKLPAKYIIHAVGPIWHGGNAGEAELLASCYVESLKLATQNRLTTIAFPAISCGVYGYPIELAAEVAITTVANFLDNDNSIAGVSFVCFSDDDYQCYLEIFGRLC
jgi:O-acetyl-ADP-ribose deacetylase